MYVLYPSLSAPVLPVFLYPGMSLGFSSAFITSRMLSSLSLITATFSSGNSSTIGASVELTPPVNSLLSTTGGFSVPLEFSTF